MQNELQQLLTDLAAERLALLERHEAGARVVSHYDFNNTYQYVIAREETHLTWLGDALAELGAPLPKASADAAGAGRRPRSGRRSSPAAFKAILEDDARTLGAFVEQWRPQVDAHDARAPPDDAQRGARRVARAPAPVRAGGRRLRGPARQAHRRRRRASAACCRPAGWSSRPRAPAMRARRDRARQQPRRPRGPRCAGAAAALRGLLTDLTLSSAHETAYVGAGAAQPPYLNAAAVGETALGARALLEALLEIERQFGRDAAVSRTRRARSISI